MALSTVIRGLFMFGLFSSATALALASTDTATTTTGRFIQDRFVISFWVDPPADQKVDDRYLEIAKANFNVVLGGFGATTTTQIQRQLDLCEKLGMKALVGVPGHDLKNLVPEHPALWGYHWVDEPGAGAFPQLAKDVAQAHALRPGKLLFINLLPDYAPPSALGTPTYQEHVRQYMDTVKADVLCMDYYPMFKPGQHDGRDGYCGDLEVMRTESLRAGVPFWNFFNTMPFGPHTDPTEAQLRWQINASLAYGAKGVLYFCYYTPGPGGEFPKGGAIIDRRDRPTRHYEQATRINAELKRLGPTLMKLTSTRVTRIKHDTTMTEALKGCAIRKIDTDAQPNFLIGEFTHEDGRRAVLLQNYHYAYTTWPSVEFDVPAEQVKEIDKETGRERKVRDDSPDLEGLQLSLDAGDARLFLLPPR